MCWHEVHPSVFCSKGSLRFRRLLNPCRKVLSSICLECPSSAVHVYLPRRKEAIFAAAELKRHTQHTRESRILKGGTDTARIVQTAANGGEARALDYPRSATTQHTHDLCPTRCGRQFVLSSSLFFVLFFSVSYPPLNFIFFFYYIS